MDSPTKVEHPTEQGAVFMAKSKYSLENRLAVVNHYLPEKMEHIIQLNALCLENISSTLGKYKHTCFSPTHFLRVPFFQPSAGIPPASGYSGNMGTLAVVFIQPALCDFPCFIQRSEQVKIQYFCPVCPVEPFGKRVLRRLTGILTT